MKTQGLNKIFQESLWVCDYLTAVASIALGAGATVGPQGILADASVQTGLGVTLIDLILTVGASKT